MGWSFVSAGARVVSSSGSFTLTEGSGWQAGDACVACIAYRGSAAITAPSGWTIVQQITTGDTATTTNGRAGLVLAVAVRGSTSLSGTWTRTGGNVAMGAICAWRPSAGVAQFGASLSQQETSDSSDVEVGPFTPLHAGALFVWMLAGGNNSVLDYAVYLPEDEYLTIHFDENTTTGADTELAVGSFVRSTTSTVTRIFGEYAPNARSASAAIMVYEVEPEPDDEIVEAAIGAVVARGRRAFVSQVWGNRRYPTLIDLPSSQPAVISQPKPTLGVPVQFGDLETHVLRITSDGKSHGYATQAAFSADGLKVFLGGYPYRIVGLDGEQIGDNITGDDIDYHQLQFWDPNDPDLLWGHNDSGSSICLYNHVTKDLQTWTIPGSYNGVRIGEGEGSISDDSRYLILVGRKTGLDNVYVIVWDTVEEAVEGTLTLEGWAFDEDFDNAHISPSGRFVVIASDKDGYRGHLIYDRATLQFLRSYSGGDGYDLTNGSADHMDIGWRTDGTEVLVRKSENRELVTVSLEDGSERVEIPREAMNWNVHISCRNIKRPGYAYVSHYYYTGNPNTYLHREIYSVRLDGTGRIERWGQGMWSGVDEYDLQPKACASPYGDVVIMTTGWGTNDPDEYLLYVPAASETVEAGVGAAVAASSGATISRARTVAAQAGAAIAQGLPAAVAQAREIEASTGSALAAGQPATFAINRTIASATGAAIAAGLPAGVGQTVTVAAGVGSAIAAGASAAVERGREIAAGVGRATATGLAAGFAFTATVAAVPGRAVAAGLQAGIAIGGAIAATAGRAVASGQKAAIAIRLGISSGIGHARAVGLPATLGKGLGVAAGTGTALAAGLPATVSTGGTIECGVGAAIARSLAATISQHQVIAATAAHARAAGLPATIGEPTMGPYRATLAAFQRGAAITASTRGASISAAARRAQIRRVG